MTGISAGGRAGAEVRQGEAGRGRAPVTGLFQWPRGQSSEKGKNWSPCLGGHMGPFLTHMARGLFHRMLEPAVTSAGRAETACFLYLTTSTCVQEPPSLRHPRSRQGLGGEDPLHTAVLSLVKVGMRRKVLMLSRHLCRDLGSEEADFPGSTSDYSFRCWTQEHSNRQRHTHPSPGMRMAPRQPVTGRPPQILLAQGKASRTGAPRPPRNRREERRKHPAFPTGNQGSRWETYSTASKAGRAMPFFPGCCFCFLLLQARWKRTPRHPGNACPIHFNQDLPLGQPHGCIHL